MLDLKLLSEPLDINKDVEFRVQSIKKQKDKVFAIVVPYKNSRTDAKRLDEVVGPLNWQREHKVINGNLFCGVGIYSEAAGQFVYKWDVGTESNTEKEKGEASDSFKRACVNWGIGRELYEFPFIYIELLPGEYYETGGAVREKNLIKNLTWKVQRNNQEEITFLGAYYKNSLRWSFGKEKSLTPPRKENMSIGSEKYKTFFNLYNDQENDKKELERQLKTKYRNAIEILENVKAGVIE